MHLRIVTSVAALAGLSLGLTACDKKAETPQPLICSAPDGSAVPCPSGAGGGHPGPSGPEQQK